ncbi:putative lipid II flippase FtsW [Aneurinibacillus sp. BA2021]|nr:putative lipid II flippase FtsW [Aneurinibacillus sp. BA2021]
MKKRGRPDFILLITTIFLVGFGVTMVYSASSIYALDRYQDYAYFGRGQAMRSAFGIVLLLIAMNIPRQFYRKYFLHILVVSFILLVIVLIPGIGIWRNGARSWLNFGVTLVQPAEFAKISLIIYLAAMITKKEDRFSELKKGFLPAISVVTLFFLLIAAQPDYGSGFILGLTAACVIYAGGARFKHLAALSVPLLLFTIVYILSSSYRMHRLLIFRNPWDDGADGLGFGYQLAHSFIALAHGGMSGAGLGKSIEKYLYLPEAHTDFIVAIIGEELGFFGLGVFLLVYLLFIWRLLAVALRIENIFSKLIAIGIASMIYIQSFVNIGGVVGLIPLTGVPLPLVSYGGSSLLVTLLSVGIVLGLSREIDQSRVEKLIAGQKTGKEKQAAVWQRTKASR